MRTCLNGHPFTPENRRRMANGGTSCRVCERARKTALRKQAGAPQRPKSPLCPQGHDDFGYRDNGRRWCRTCKRDRDYWRRHPVDGLEALYGPVPPRDPELVDWVLEARKDYERGPQRRERVSPVLRSSIEGHIGDGGLERFVKRRRRLFQTS